MFSCFQNYSSWALFSQLENENTVMFMSLRKKPHLKFHNHCLSEKENWITPNSGISCKATEHYQTFFKVILFLVIG